MDCEIWPIREESLRNHLLNSVGERCPLKWLSIWVKCFHYALLSFIWLSSQHTDSIYMLFVVQHRFRNFNGHRQFCFVVACQTSCWCSWPSFHCAQWLTDFHYFMFFVWLVLVPVKPGCFEWKWSCWAGFWALSVYIILLIGCQCQSKCALFLKVFRKVSGNTRMKCISIGCLNARKQPKTVNVSFSSAVALHNSYTAVSEHDERVKSNRYLKSTNRDTGEKLNSNHRDSFRKKDWKLNTKRLSEDLFCPASCTGSSWISQHIFVCRCMGGSQGLAAVHFGHGAAQLCTFKLQVETQIRLAGFHSAWPNFW